MLLMFTALAALIRPGLFDFSQLFLRPGDGMTDPPAVKLNLLFARTPETAASLLGIELFLPMG